MRRGMSCWRKRVAWPFMRGAARYLSRWAAIFDEDAAPGASGSSQRSCGNLGELLDARYRSSYGIGELLDARCWLGRDRWELLEGGSGRVTSSGSFRKLGNGRLTTSWSFWKLGR